MSYSCFPQERCWTCCNSDADSRGFFCILTGGEFFAGETCPDYEKEKDRVVLKDSEGSWMKNT